MTTYGIVDYIPEHARRYAASRHYSHHGGSATRITTDGFCPLGAALHRWKPAEAAKHSPCVSDEIVSFVILRDSPAEEDVWDTIERLAAEFINDWDDGKITDLSWALGFRPGGDA